jgi:indolepyruvate ferredoxin oxidoreductase
VAKSLAAIAPSSGSIFVNTHETYPGDFTRHADLTLPSARILEAIKNRAGEGRVFSLDATELATALLGDSIATNMLMLGFAWQSGAIPLTRAAIERAIELNGVDVAENKAAFAWGRRAASEPADVAAIAARGRGPRGDPLIASSLDDKIARRIAFLTAYQDSAYAVRYAEIVARVCEAERRVALEKTALGEAVAVNLFKLMAIKDEYEVARLFTDGSFRRQLWREFSSWGKLEFHLAPPLFAKRDPITGHLKKRTFGPWMMRVFGLLALAKGLRGTRFDIFGYATERKAERALVAEYQETIDVILANLSMERYELAVSLAEWPQLVRGFGHVKEAGIVRARIDAAVRRDAFLREAAGIAEAAE